MAGNMVLPVPQLLPHEDDLFFKVLKFSSAPSKASGAAFQLFPVISSGRCCLFISILLHTPNWVPPFALNLLCLKYGW